jgi:hypothetical protein
MNIKENKKGWGSKRKWKEGGREEKSEGDRDRQNMEKEAGDIGTPRRRKKHVKAKNTLETKAFVRS